MYGAMDVAFANPAVLSALPVAAVPLLVHWLMRPRPRRVLFPPVALLAAALAGGRRAQRLRDWLLLLLRCLLIALVLLLLAGPVPRLGPADRAAPESGPVAGILVLDDSISTSLRLTPTRRRSDEMADVAFDWLSRAAAWDAGSSLQVIRSDPASSPGEPTTDFTRAAALAKSPAAPHAASLSVALDRAAASLSRAVQPTRRLAIVTDGCAHAWRDVRSGPLREIDGLAVDVFVPAEAPFANLALLTADSPARVSPLERPIPIRVSVRSAGAPVEASIQVESDRAGRDSRGPIRLVPDATTAVAAQLPGGPPGYFFATISISPSDHLEFDQTRYVAGRIGDPPRATLIDRLEPESEDVGWTIIRSLLSPPSLDPKALPFSFQIRPASEVETDTEAAAPVARSGRFIAASELLGSDIAPDQPLRRAVESGATLFLMADSSDRAASSQAWRTWFTVETPSIEVLPGELSLSWLASSRFARDSGALSEIRDLPVSRRVRLDRLQPGVNVLAVFSDGLPAVVERGVGHGRVLAVATSPDPRWSRLGVRAAPLLTLLHEAIHETRPALDSVWELEVGQRRNSAPGSLPDSATLEVRQILPLEQSGPRLWSLEVRQGLPVDPWPTPSAGCYSVRVVGQSRDAGIYTVNWPPHESDLGRISEEEIARALGVADVRVRVFAEHSATLQSQDRAGWFDRWMPADVAALALILVLLAEAYVALHGERNRRQESVEPA